MICATISLTPGFSRVAKSARQAQPFQRLTDGGKTVKTVLVHSDSSTGLKPGVNGLKAKVVLNIGRPNRKS